jgi:hypothetical protein
MDVDQFAAQLLEESKRFLEKSKLETSLDGQEAYFHAALLLAFAAFEAHINSIADDFLVRDDLSILDQSILSEREFVLSEGRWVLTDRLRIYRIEDRIQYLQEKFSTTPLDKSSFAWGHLQEGLRLRNRLTHPKQAEPISAEHVSRAIESIIESLDCLYMAIYKRPFPAARRSLDSTLSF